MNFTFHTTPEIIFRAGATKDLGDFAKGGFKRPVLLTDKGLIAAGLVEPAIESLEAAGLTVLLFDDVAADPPAAKVKQAVDIARAHGADGVIGLGGGSSMDTAKVVSVLLNSARSLEDIYGTDMVTEKRAPLILCPTTSGTGSEVTPISVITKEDDTKIGVVDNALYPDVAVLDPALTLGLPRNATAATGVDAMVHAMAYPLGGIFHVPHGLSNALMLEPVLRFNAPNADHLYAELADIIAPGATGADAQKCDAFIKRIVEIVEATGVERRLSQVGVSHNDLPRMAEDALKGQRLLVNNPRPVTYDDALAMYTEVL